MARLRPIAYFVAAGCIGALLGTALAQKLPHFWAWFISGSIMAVIIVSTNQRLRNKWFVVISGVLVTGFTVGGISYLIDRF